MLSTEKEKLKTIVEQIKALGQSTLSTSEDILEALKNCDSSCDMSQIHVLTKEQRYEAIDEIDNLIITVFALYSPEARDLRLLVAYLKITNEFDRIAKQCNAFIRDFPNAIFSDIDKDFILEYAVPLQKSSVNTLNSVVNLLAEKDKDQIQELYTEIVIEESKNDDLYKIIEKSLLKKMKKELHLSYEYQSVMAALRRLEKIADRALSIANLMHYAKIGGELGNQ
jgi:phosphate transport system protein